MHSFVQMPCLRCLQVIGNEGRDPSNYAPVAVAWYIVVGYNDVARNGHWSAI